MQGGHPGHDEELQGEDGHIGHPRPDQEVYGHRDLVKRASTAVLHDLVNVIVMILLEPGVADLPEGGQLVMAINVFTVKIVDQSDHNVVSGPSSRSSCPQTRLDMTNTTYSTF